MKRTKPVIECEDCRYKDYFMDDETPWCHAVVDRAAHKKPCPDGQPREYGSCGECFWLGEQIPNVDDDKNLYACCGNSDCGSAFVYHTRDGRYSHVVTEVRKQGGIFWWPRNTKE